MVIHGNRPASVRVLGCWIVALLIAGLLAAAGRGGATQVRAGGAARGDGANPPSASASASGSRRTHDHASGPTGGPSARAPGGPATPHNAAIGGTGLTLPTIGIPGPTTTTAGPGRPPGHDGSPPAVAGRVVDELGRPVAGECVFVDAVWLLTMEPEMTTGSDGQFEFSDQQIWPPGTPNLSGGASGAVVVHDCSDRVPGFETTTVSVDLRGRVPNVPVAVAPGAAVVGTLLDAQHLPLAGYCVYVGEPRSSVLPPHTVTDSLGHFTVNGVVPGSQKLVAATGDCGQTLIHVEPESVIAAGVTPVVATVPASEDSFASAAQAWSRGDVDHATMHTIGATVEAGEAPPSCLPAATRTTWRLVEAEYPTVLGIRVMRGAGAVAIYAQDDSGGRGPEVACTLVTGATPSQIPFGGMRPGHGPTGSALGLPWYWIQLASGPDPVVVDLS